MREKVKGIIARRTRSQIKLYFLIFIVVAGTLASVIYLKTVSAGEAVVTLQNQERQLVLARSAAAQIEFFLEGLRRDVLRLASVEDVSAGREEEARKTLQEFIDNAPTSPLIGFARIDKSGKVIVIANKKRLRTGERKDFSYRDYFKWARDPQNRNKAYTTDPFISRVGVSQGKMVMVVAAPSYFKNEFNGVTMGAILLEKFAETFIDPIKLESKTEVLLTTRGGRVIYDRNGLLNQNLVDYAKSKKWQGWEEFVGEFEKIQKEEEGIGAWSFQHVGASWPETQVIAFKTIRVGDESWKLIIINHKNFVKSYMLPITSSQNLGFFLILFSFITGGMLFVFIDHLSHRDGYLKGYKDGLDELFSKKKGK